MSVLARCSAPLAAAGLRVGAPQLLAPVAASLLATSGSASWRFGSGFAFSTSAAARRAAAADGKPDAEAGNGGAAAEPGEQQAEEQQQAAEQQQASAAGLSPDDLAQALAEAQQALEEERKRSQDVKDKLLRTLADMENLRERTARTTQEAKTFAVQGLVKNLLEVADTLERAYGSVPDADVADTSEIDRDRALKLLRSLRDGVMMTDTMLMKVFAKEGVTRYDPVNQPFDPNLHNALFEVPDATKEPSTVAVVVKRGYMLNDRVVRAADVGVTRAMEE
ncbi:grpE-like protein, mitochondrial-like [Micractinium conductrix]|uniref:GrpE protein homolog n=1 Tax=Micractinium conductrix TaxID=554055 RepID=A0A2P6VMG5_9CHLO|nr:grpE-like protein, mitochondrial-like [Micractinium conductrix]|eukprot:PSC75280.1 grpE-like protein, mitochondrial-like [Micractinium conductrix]